MLTGKFPAEKSPRKNGAERHNLTTACSATSCSATARAPSSPPTPITRTDRSPACGRSAKWCRSISETTRTVGLVFAINKSDLAMDNRQPQRHRGQCRIDRRGSRPSGQWQAHLRPRHHQLPLYRSDRAPHPRPRLGRGLRSRGAAARSSPGQLSQDEAIDACIAIDETLNRHFAVVGTTGVGKSTAVALLLRKAIKSRPDLRILILDPHNEFAGGGFRKQPFASFQLRWICRSGCSSWRNSRRCCFAAVKRTGRGRPAARSHSSTPSRSIAIQVGRPTFAAAATAARSPPTRRCRIAWPILLKQIDERMGQLETKNDRPAYRSLRGRIEAGDRRSALSLHVQFAADRGHDPRNTGQDLSGSRIKAGRSPAWRWPACPPRSSIPFARCWRAWRSTWRC